MPQRQMMTERMIEIAPVVIALLAGSFLAAIMPSTIWVAVTLGVTVIVVVLLWLRLRKARHPYRSRNR